MYGQLGDGTTIGRMTSVWTYGLGTTRTIRLSSGNLAFGSLVVGNTTTASLIIDNDGDGPLTVGGIDCPAGFSGSWHGTIAAGSYRLINVTFAPTVVGPYGGTVTVRADHTDGTNTAEVSGTGSPVGTRIIALSGDLAFGDVTVGNTASRTLTISNLGTLPLSVSSVSYPGGFAGNWSGSIPPGGSQLVPVTFSPSEAVTYRGYAWAHSDRTEGTDTIRVSGTGIPPTRIMELTGDLSFGNVLLGTTATRTLTISNSGTGTMTVTGMSLPTGFSGTWSGTIPPGGSRAVTVTFAPTSAVRSGGRVTVSGNQTSGTNFVRASGTGRVANGATAVAAGHDHTCAVTSTGAVQCWGRNTDGQVGDGTTVARLTPVTVSGLSSGVDTVAVGSAHSCAVTTAGGLVCWGANERGQPGTGTTSPRSTPTDVTGLTSGVLAVSPGWQHTCAMTAAGGVKCWGANSYGQLGDGTTIERLTPVYVVGLTSGVVALSTGLQHACAVTNAGAVKCWGYGGNGGLGVGSLADHSTPVDVVGLAAGAVAMAAGSSHSCALTAGGGVKCWGCNQDGQIGDATTSTRTTPVDVTGLATGVVAIEAGGSHTCALTTSGRLRCWGNNTFGGLGDSTTVDRLTPVDVTGLADGVAAMSAGSLHTCAVTTGGGIRCWGYNAFGSLGDGTTTDRLVPAEVRGLGETRSIALSGDLSFGSVLIGTTAARTLTIANTGTATLSISGITYPPGFSGAWSGEIPAGGAQVVTVTFAPVVAGGYGGTVSVGADNTTGTNTATASGVGAFTRGVVAIAAGAAHACAVTSGGAAECWGYNDTGQLGDGTTTGRLAPATVTGLGSGVAAISAGNSHTCALTSRGGVLCGGENGFGQLGDNSTVRRLAPVAVSGLTEGVATVVTGSRHSCALTTAGAVLCWGSNLLGEVGDGTTIARPAPVTVSGLTSGVVALGVGAYHTCAVLDDASVRCWGSNASGQLGDGTTTLRRTPVTVSGLPPGTEPLAVTGGIYHTCIVTRTGQALCWGANHRGQLGDGTTSGQMVPTVVSGLTDIVALDAGSSHTCALTASGGARCWGENLTGQVGDGTTVNRNIPVVVTDLESGTAAIQAGGGHTCAVTAGGGVRCWGKNGDGQLGDGTTADHTTPGWVAKLGETRIISLSGDMAFGVTMVGTTGVRLLTIGNSGNGLLSVTGITCPAGFSSAWSGTIPPGGFETVVVTFAPSEATASGGVLTVHADQSGGTNTTDVSGTGIQTTKLMALSGELAFGRVPVGRTATRELTIGNNGNTVLTVTGISYPEGFSGAFRGTIAPGTTEQVTVSFTPTAAATFGGTVVVNGDATGGANAIAISGTGVPRNRDFDGDGLADAAVYRPESGTWFSLDSSTGRTTYQSRGWGVQSHGDLPVIGDFDGDEILDPTVYRPATGTWFILESRAGYTTWRWFGWGAATDLLVPGDYDGDGSTDAAVYRPSTGEWFVRPSSGATPWSVVFGQFGDQPIAGDFDGDGRRDPAVYRPSSGTWFWLKSTANLTEYGFRGWGVLAHGDTPAPGDYDGDGRTDPCVYRAATGTWFILESAQAYTTWRWFGWGSVGDSIAPADYDGDGLTDVAIYRPTTGQWFVRPSDGSSTWNVVFGQTGDVPLVVIR
jgi:alpha-tubulin suppressor-like RCC1 family protein